MRLEELTTEQLRQRLRELDYLYSLVTQREDAAQLDEEIERIRAELRRRNDA